MKKIAAFTLIELLIVIAIIALLASITYPSYLSYLITMRRSDAQAVLIKAQLKQSSLHILNPTYSVDKSELGLLDNHYYNFTTLSASASTYLIKATAKMGTSQADDETACKTLYVDQNSSHTSDGSTPNEQCW
ncbi:type IV pilin protein [Psychromonas sp. MME2]|uniref:type IV pilin protein n=1 Tax=Psychromonas sp. MME2 TaxID=3231033 RepID=UPI00339BA264